MGYYPNQRHAGTRRTAQQAVSEEQETVQVTECGCGMIPDTTPLPPPQPRFAGRIPAAAPSSINMGYPAMTPSRVPAMPGTAIQTPASGAANMQFSPLYPGQMACPGQVAGPVEQKPVAMAYVPWQQWGQTYPLNQALSVGTIFPELDLRFLKGRC